MKVTHGVDHGLEHFARFQLAEWRPAQRGGERIVGRFEYRVADHFAAVAGSPAIEEFD